MRNKKGVEAIIQKYADPNEGARIDNMRALVDKYTDQSLRRHIQAQIDEYDSMITIITALPSLLSPLAKSVFDIYYVDDYTANDTAAHLLIGRTTLWGIRREIVDKFECLLQQTKK